MSKLTFDDLTFSKVAFLAGYTGVYRNEFGPQEKIASPNKWVMDSTSINDFAFDHNVELVMADEGDSYQVTEHSERFFQAFKDEIQKAETTLVNDLLEEERLELEKRTV
jgi:hypothetical protein